MHDLEQRRQDADDAKSDLTSGVVHPGVDAAVRASWLRCAPGVAPHTDAAPVDASDHTSDLWDRSPIRRFAPGLVDHLELTATSGDLIAAVSDAEGRVLWQSTPRWLRPGAERIGLRPGGVWHEATTGTNGIGVALAADMPARVFATEHWLHPVHDWVCYAAPVHGPDGAQLGAVNLSTTWRHANPLALATVASIAQVIEHEIRLDRDASLSAVPQLELRVLGAPSATLDGEPLKLTLRQFEILTVLATLRTSTLGELHANLYGDRPVSVATLKSEISRLRRALGGRLSSRPYRLGVTCSLDAATLLERLDAGDTEGAARLYAGQLLPTSEAPFLVDHRHHIDVALRTALLQRGTPAGVLRYSAVNPYDVEVIERARARTTVDDPLVPALTARLAVATAL